MKDTTERKIRHSVSITCTLSELVRIQRYVKSNGMVMGRWLANLALKEIKDKEE
jgi:hypothetical protein